MECGRKSYDVLEDYGLSMFRVRIRAASNAADLWDIDGHERGIQTTGAGASSRARGTTSKAFVSSVFAVHLIIIITLIGHARQTVGIVALLILAQALGCSIGQACQPTEIEPTVVFAKAISRRIRQVRQAVEVEVSLMLAEAPGRPV